MYFLLSGEGDTDIGRCDGAMSACEGDRHLPGPMAIIVSQIFERQHKFSFLEFQCYGYVSEQELKKKALKLKRLKKAPLLPGRKRPKETIYFYENARAMALCAKAKEAEKDDVVIAVLFRDSDGSASAGRGHWKDKRDSISKGFIDEGFERGVPMVPKPKSEAWIICSVKNNPYQGCAALEERSGNDKSPNSLKRELAQILGERPTREKLCEMVEDGTIDIDRIDMPSFVAFKNALFDVIRP